MRRNFLFCVVLFASLVSHAVDSTVNVALPDTVAVGDRCEAKASPPGRVVSGGQVLGCDWAWANPSGDFATWASRYPAEPARQHGVRFEGEYVPVGPGGGIPRIYEWALNVTDPQKTCDYSLFSEIPPADKMSGAHDQKSSNRCSVQLCSRQRQRQPPVSSHVRPHSSD